MKTKQFLTYLMLIAGLSLAGHASAPTVHDWTGEGDTTVTNSNGTSVRFVNRSNEGKSNVSGDGLLPEPDSPRTGTVPTSNTDVVIGMGGTSGTIGGGTTTTSSTNTGDEDESKENNVEITGFLTRIIDINPNAVFTKEDIESVVSAINFKVFEPSVHLPLLSMDIPGDDDDDKRNEVRSMRKGQKAMGYVNYTLASLVTASSGTGALIGSFDSDNPATIVCGYITAGLGAIGLVGNGLYSWFKKSAPELESNYKIWMSNQIKSSPDLLTNWYWGHKTIFRKHLNELFLAKEEV